MREARSLQRLTVEVFADGASLDGIRKLGENPLVKGFTTNPALMRKAGVSDYLAFAREARMVFPGKPISLEVISDNFEEMYRQAMLLAELGDNVYVKIPVTNTHAKSSCPLIRRLSRARVHLNITAILTERQVEEILRELDPLAPPAYISVFAGRIADTGIDPVPVMNHSRGLVEGIRPNAILLWASVREVLNIFQADECGCGIVTVPHDILAKAIKLVGTDLDLLSLDTVKMFRTDAVEAGYELPT